MYATQHMDRCGALHTHIDSDGSLDYIFFPQLPRHVLFVFDLGTYCPNPEAWILDPNRKRPGILPEMGTGKSQKCPVLWRFFFGRSSFCTMPWGSICGATQSCEPSSENHLFAPIFFQVVSSRKLTACTWKWDFPKGKEIVFQPSIFRGYVSFREANFCWEPLIFKQEILPFLQIYGLFENEIYIHQGIYERLKPSQTDIDEDGRMYPSWLVELRKNMPPKNGQEQKESRLPSIIFHGTYFFLKGQSPFTLVSWIWQIPGKISPIISIISIGRDFGSRNSKKLQETTKFQKAKRKLRSGRMEQPAASDRFTVMFSIYVEASPKFKSWTIQETQGVMVKLALSKTGDRLDLTDATGTFREHMGPHGTTHGTTATEESGVPCPATGNLGSIPQKIETYWGNLGAQIPTLVGFFEVLFSWMFRLDKSCFFKMECFLKGGGDFHGVYRPFLKAPIFPFSRKTRLSSPFC